MSNHKTVIVSTGIDDDGGHFVELSINAHVARLTVGKARDVAQLLVEAAEAIVSDAIVLGLLDEIGIMDLRKRQQILLDLREKRQGTRGPAWPT